MWLTKGRNYTIPQIDLCRKPEGLPQELSYLYDLVTVDNSKDYLAHPDAILRKDGSLLNVYPAGHGQGAIQTKISRDGGKSYPESLLHTPKSWEKSLETPTIYRLEFCSPAVQDKLLLISANPKWGLQSTPGGFHCSLSEDEGESWTEFALFYPKDEPNGVIPIVAMASLTRLKENGAFVDRWMGLFHDWRFYNYKSILSFDEAGRMRWSAPEKYMAPHRRQERGAHMCEVEVIRSDKGQGDTLCLLARSNSKRCNSLISFSRDEGKTWSKPREVPAALNGERHKAEYTSDGRLVIVFRSIERDKAKRKRVQPDYSKRKFYSEGLIAWVGTFDDLQQGKQGQYRIKLAHTYLPGQTQAQTAANADTGYCGNVVLPDDTVVITSYGCFDGGDYVTNTKGETVPRTSIASKRLRLSDIDRVAERYC